VRERDANLAPDKPGQPGDKPSPEGTPSGPGSGQPEGAKGPEGVVDIDKLSDEQVEQLLAEQEKEELEQLGLGKFKSYKELVKAFKDRESDGSSVYNEIKDVADRWNMTPKEFVAELKARSKQPDKGTPKGDQKPDDKTPSKEAPSQDVKEIKDALGRQLLNRLFDKFQRQMERDDIEIPDKLQKQLDDYLPIATHGKTDKDFEEGFNPYDTAYEYYLFKMQKGGNVDDLKGQIGALETSLNRKRVQLKIRTGGKSKKTPQEREQAEAFGFDD
jgi:hypothetical protein